MEIAEISFQLFYISHLSLFLLLCSSSLRATTRITLVVLIMLVLISSSGFECLKLWDGWWIHAVDRVSWSLSFFPVQKWWDAWVRTKLIQKRFICIKWHKKIEKARGRANLHLFCCCQRRSINDMDDMMCNQGNHHFIYCGQNI